MPLENLSTSSRFAHSRKVLAHAPQLQLFKICQELWIEGDQAATVPAFLSVRGSVRSILCPFVDDLRPLGQAGGGRADPAGASIPVRHALT